jgi:hypothetical protein
MVSRYFISLFACVFIRPGVYLFTRMMQRYNELPPDELLDPQSYLKLPKNRKFLPAFSRFYNRFGPTTPHTIERCIDNQKVKFSDVVACEMTQTYDRSVVILRANQAEFDEITYRLFMYTFESTSDDPMGIKAEYRLLSEEFGTVPDNFNPQPNRFMKFQFEKVMDYNRKSAIQNDRFVSITLGEDERIQNILTTGNGHTLRLDHVTNLAIPETNTIDSIISVGQHALRQEIALLEPALSL